MKIFTLAEANDVLTKARPILEEIQELYERLEGFRSQARAAAAVADQGGGMPGGTTYLDILFHAGKLSSEIAELGIEVKDPRRGLIDFPSMRGDRVVYLCWQIGDGDEIGWWHETDAGFAGRTRL